MIRVRCFAKAAEIVGDKYFDFKGDSSTVDELKSHLLKAYPEFDSLDVIRIAVNEEYAEGDQLISVNDDVVIIPPVSGG